MMKPSMMTLMATISNVAAAMVDPIPIWPTGLAPGDKPDVFGPEDHSFPFLDDEHITNVTLPTLTPFWSTTPADAAVVVAPGGGYSILAWNKEGTDIAAWLNSIGIHAFVLKYRVPARDWLPFGEAPLMDAQRSMGLVRQRAQAYGLNASRIGFIGFSAGGHLGAHLAANCSAAPLQRAYPRVDAADDFSCAPSLSFLVYPWSLVEDAARLPVSRAWPPAFFAHAFDDPTAPVGNSLQQFTRLKDAGAPPSELHVYPKGGHGYGRCTVGASKELAGEEICNWPERGAAFARALGFAPPELKRRGQTP